MIRFIQNGNLFDSTAGVLVNPVNTSGAMGKGLALEFKKRFPEYVPIYAEACSSGALVVGKPMFVPNVVRLRPGVVLFPTKKHWRGKAKLEWISKGLEELRNNYRIWGIHSIAMPALGCGLGGLTWTDVRSIIQQTFNEEELEIEVYEPWIGVRNGQTQR